MRMSYLGLLSAFLVVALASAGCNKKNTNTGNEPGPGGGPGPGGDPGPKPKGKRDSIPLSEFPYDPIKPDFKIDLAKFSSSIAANDPVAKDWVAANGKVVEVRGVMGTLSAGPKTRRETYLVKGEHGGGTIACESLFPPNWRKESPGRIVTVVGRLDVQDQGGINISLTDAHVMATSNVEGANPEVTAEQLGNEYTANAAGFDKKWKVPGKYYYVTGTLKRIDKIPLSGGASAIKFIVGAGKTDLYCHIQNERGVNEDPPKVGDKVTLLLECQGYDGTFKGISMAGVYVDKGQ